MKKTLDLLNQALAEFDKAELLKTPPRTGVNRAPNDIQEENEKAKIAQSHAACVRQDILAAIANAKQHLLLNPETAAPAK